jgi:hypothetical protein
MLNNGERRLNVGPGENFVDQLIEILQVAVFVTLNVQWGSERSRLGSLSWWKTMESNGSYYHMLFEQELVEGFSRVPGRRFWSELMVLCNYAL